jgi:HK97 gp10 family phage protein
MVGVQISGLQELQDRLRAMRENARQHAEVSLRVGAQPVMDRLVSAAPVRTGRLRDAIKLVTSSSGSRSSVQITVDPAALYWRYLQYGTKFIRARGMFKQVWQSSRSEAQTAVGETFRDEMLKDTQ